MFTCLLLPGGYFSVKTFFVCYIICLGINRNETSRSVSCLSSVSWLCFLRGKLVDVDVKFHCFLVENILAENGT